MRSQPEMPNIHLIDVVWCYTSRRMLSPSLLVSSSDIHLNIGRVLSRAFSVCSTIAQVPPVRGTPSSFGSQPNVNDILDRSEVRCDILYSRLYSFSCAERRSRGHSSRFWYLCVILSSFVLDLCRNKLPIHIDHSCRCERWPQHLLPSS